jgi:hypothetical protein
MDPFNPVILAVNDQGRRHLDEEICIFTTSPEGSTKDCMVIDAEFQGPHLSPRDCRQTKLDTRISIDRRFMILLISALYKHVL